MNVSSPPVLGATAQRASRRPAEPINNLASTESQGLSSEHFETSSQFSESDCSDIGEDFWEPRAIISDCSERRSPLNLSDTEDHFLDHVSIQREASKSGIVDAFSKTRQPTSQPENPFHPKTAAPQPPTLPNQQEITDSNRQQPFNKIKRPSRHELYQEILSSEQTDYEFESNDKKIKRKAQFRLSGRKSRQIKANKLRITIVELNKQYHKKAQANKRSLTAAELIKQQKQAQADKRCLTVAGFRRQERQAQALKKSPKSPI